MMDEDAFRSFLKDQRKPANTIAQFIRLINEFDDYLNNIKRINLNMAKSEDLHNFFNWLDQKFRHPVINRYFFALKAYYEFKSNNDLFCAANEILGITSLEILKLKDFLGVNPEYSKILASHKIRTAQQLLSFASTKADREKLSNDFQIPEESILELVKLSNLARIPGLKQKRARLFYNAGLDTLDKIAAFDDVEDLVKFFAEFVERSGFDGRAVTSSEAALTHAMAKYLKRIIEV